MANVNSISSFDFEGRGGISAITNVFAITAQASELISSTAGLFAPWLAIVTTPLTLYELIQDVKTRYRLFRVAERVKDKAFWLFRGLGLIGGAVSQSLKPVVGTLSLSGFRISGTAVFVFQRVMPLLMLVSSSVGLVASSWALGRVVRDYTCMKREVNQGNVDEFLSRPRSAENQARFKESLTPYEQPFDQMNPEQRWRALKMGARFSLYDHTNDLVVGIISITAAILLLVSGQYHVVSASLIITSSVLSVIPIIIKNILIRKSKKMIDSSLCPVISPPCGFSTSPAS